ncbi:haloacid dehalogenase [Devosia riboflavina]|uniref:Haloacid dehalogenase n=1 Tax=Devosia riboflavina TaxID=46914 RepID=A0A087LZL3_9HYPH|nr:HAD-IA family hydrolase [Devosia riboflavina]KFL30066.1 haloacid dehalogenase [Devosia riboflavina]
MQIIMMDVDGVLVAGRPKDGAHLFTDLEADLGISAPTLQREFFKPRWPDIITGRKALLPELAEFLTDIASAVSAQTLIDYWFENDSRLVEAVIEGMAELRTRGHLVYLATNQEHMRATYLMEVMGLARQVDGIFYSAAIGHRKPSQQFYRHIQDTLGSSPDDITLVDDTEDNVIAAREQGWNAIHWRANMSLLDELAKVPRRFPA